MDPTLSPQPQASTTLALRIGSGDGQIDLQPCGGALVRSTGEIGPVTLGKIANKGKQNRRVSLSLA